MKRRRVIWDSKALNCFRDAINYIRKDSPQNAERVKREVLLMIRELSLRPEIHSPDKFKIKNNGNYRAFELHRLRVSYLVKEDVIIVARVRNVRQEPLGY